MKKVLIFQHEFREHPSRLNQYALENNIELRVIRLWEPYEIPNVSAFDALIILGGSMRVNDNYPSMNDELDAIRKNSGKTPILGICLGSQLIAHALGSNVMPVMVDNKPHYEMGFQTVTLTAEGKKSKLFKGFPDEFVVTQLHGDTFELPKGATHLAQEPSCPNQAFEYGGNTFGVQFHLEYSPYALAHLFDFNRKFVRGNYEAEEKKFMDEAYKTESVMQEQFNRLMNNFLSV